MDDLLIVLLLVLQQIVLLLLLQQVVLLLLLHQQLILLLLLKLQVLIVESLRVVSCSYRGRGRASALTLHDHV